MKNRVIAILLTLILAFSLTACASSVPKAYEVRFEMNGGTLISGRLLQHVEEGGAAEAPELEREGFVFKGWSESFDTVSENMVVAAQWERLTVEPEPTPTPVYEVRFEMNGGTLISGRLLQHVEEGGAAEAPELEREGFVFKGWSESFDTVSENMVVAALWSRSYHISFDAAGGRIVSGEKEQTVVAGQLPAEPKVEQEFADFAGWSPELSTAEADTVYTAQWAARRLDSEEIFAKISPAVVEIEAYEPSGAYYSLGSGFFINDSGLFVTNYHVIDGTNAGVINLHDGSSCEILCVRDYDKALDLAIVQADTKGNAFLKISSRPVTTGETIYALGSSQGLTSTFSSGIVSTASRAIEGVNYIQTTAPISQGNSGGPLVDPYGEVVGVNSMTLTTGQNLNFAIEIHELEKLTQTRNLTLAQIYEIEYPAGGSGTVSELSTDGFYGQADAAEQEPNDVFLLSDTLQNGQLVAGEVSDTTDLDWFYLELDAPCDVDFLVVPYYTDDMDYLLCGILSFQDDDVQLMDALMPVEGLDFDAFGGTIHFDEAGSYFLLVTLDERYAFETPSYYILEASW